MADKPLLIFPHPQAAERLKRSSSQPPNVHFPSHERQGQRLAPKFGELQRSFQQRSISLQTTPVDSPPEQVIVFETIGSVDTFLTAVRNTSGMTWLADWAEEELAPDDDFHLEDQEKKDEQLSGRLYIVMSNQEAIEQMLSLWNRFQHDSQAKFDRGLNAWKALFSHLRDVRRWGVKDRLEDTGILKNWHDQLEHKVDPLRFEVELWCGQNEDDQRRVFESFRRIVEEEQGQCLAQCYIPEIAYHGVLVQAPAKMITPLLEQEETKLVRADEVMFFRPLGQAAFVLPEQVDTTESEPPDGGIVPHGDPLVALLDGMPLENHAHLAGRLLVDDPDNWASTYQANERHHGTTMASLIVHGELDASEPPLSRPLYVRPVMKPDVNSWRQPRTERIPEDVLPIDLFHRAVRRIVEGEGQEPPVAPHVRIINLSLGDPSQPFQRYISPWARIFDWLAWKHNILFVISAGNQIDDIELETERTALANLSQRELQAETLKALRRTELHRTLLAPAESINAVTVGALHSDNSSIVAMGTLMNPYVDGVLPSPYSRIGPGFRRSVKPDILVAGGRALYREKLGNTHAVATLQFPSSVRAPGQRVACPGNSPGDTSASYYIRGTSNAAALASRWASIIYDRLLQVRSEPNGQMFEERYLTVMVKALLVHAARWGECRTVFDSVFGGSFERQDALRNYLSRYLGYGTPEYERIITCTDQRATIIGCGSLANGAADLFRVPLPPSLSAQRIWRRLIVTLAWNSPINPRHQKYRQAQLWVRPNRDILGVEWKDVVWQAVERGTVQHAVMEGNLAKVYADGDTLELRVNCREDAGKMRDQVPYRIAVTLEVAEGVSIPIYDEVRVGLSIPIPIRTS